VLREWLVAFGAALGCRDLAALNQDFIDGHPLLQLDACIDGGGDEQLVEHGTSRHRPKPDASEAATGARS